MRMWRLLDDMNPQGKNRSDPTIESSPKRLNAATRSARDLRPVFRVLTGLLVVMIAWLAFRPSVAVDQGLPWDKANHALAFLVLTMISVRGWPGAGFWRLGAVMLLGGAAIEIIQGLSLVGRDRDGWDVAADMVGFGLGWTAVLALRWSSRRHGVRE